MTTRTQRRTTEAILRAASRVLVRNPGASLSEIGEAAGVGRTTLHRYFPKREDLLHGLVRASLYEIDRAGDQLDLDGLTARETLSVVLEALVPLGDRCHFLWLAPQVYEDRELAATYGHQLEQLQALAQRLKDEGEIALDVPTAWIVATLDSLVFTAWFQVEQGLIAPRDAPRLVERTLLSQLNEPSQFNTAPLRPRARAKEINE